MSLFQKSVEKNYLNVLDSGLIDTKYKDEREEYFNSYKSEINQHQSEIEKTDKEIDQMVYEFYGLTEGEIKIVENS